MNPLHRLDLSPTFFGTFFFLHKVFQTHLILFLAKPWNQPFLSEGTDFFKEKWHLETPVFLTAEIFKNKCIYTYIDAYTYISIYFSIYIFIYDKILN